MAQVIKYQQGGSTSKKYGTFTIDGNKYEVDDEFLNQISSYGKSLDGDTAYQFSKITDALRSGANLSYDSSADRLDGDVNFDVTGKQENRLNKRRSRFGRMLGNTWKGKENTSRNAINALKGFTYIAPTPGGTDYDWSRGINIEYKKDKDGKYELVDGKRVFIQGANNIQALRRLDSIKDIINYTDNDTFKGYGKLDKQAYIDLYKRLGDDGIRALRDRIESGTWTDEDKLALDDIGLLLDNEPSAEEIAQKAAALNPEAHLEQKERERYQKAGWDYNARNIFGINDDGSVSIIDPELQQYIGSGDAWLNDEFKAEHGAYADYIPDKTGLFVINGKVYKGDNQDALSKVQKFLDFVAENKKTAGNASGIKQYWKDNTYSGWNNTSVDPEGNPIWSPYFQPNKYVSDISGRYIRQEGDPLIYEYLSDYNPEDNSQFDFAGHPLRDRAQRVYIDPVTKQVINYTGSLQEQSNRDAIEKYYQSNPRTAFNPYHTIGNRGGYKVVANTGSSNNPNTKAELYYNPENKEYYWYDENPGGNNLTLNNKLPSGSDKMRDYYWNIDPRLGEYIQQHPDVIKNPDVKNLISEMIQNAYLAGWFTTRRQTDFSSVMNKYPELYKLFTDLYKNQSLKFGNTRQTFSGSGGNRDIRSITTPEELESMGLAYRVQSNKNGGVLKHQIGGVATNRKSATRASQESIQQSNKKLRSAGQEKTIGDGTDLNTADKAELAALIADAASLGATFVPVYGNVAGAGIGAVGSLTGFGADVARDGLDWGDVGNLALNLGLDAATLLPGVGTGAKATKIAKALKSSKAIAKAVKYASTAVSLGSAAGGLTTAWNNIQDGSWTIKDIRTVLNGVRGIANLSRTKGSAKTKESSGDTVTLKSKSRELPDIKLNKSELQAIESTPKAQRADKLEELIINKIPKKAKTDQVTDVLAEYGVKKSGIDWNWRKPLKVSTNQNVSTKQFDFDKVAGNYRNPNELGWWNWNRSAALRDAKTNRNNPYFKDFARTQTSEIAHTPLEVIRRPEVDGNITRAQISEPNVSITSYRKAPITMPIYSNFAPDFGVFNITPDRRQYFDLNNKPIFYKKGGKVIKAAKGDKVTPWYGLNFNVNTQEPVVVRAVKPSKINNQQLEADMNSTFTDGQLDLDMQNTYNTGLNGLNKTNNSNKQSFYGGSGSGFLDRLENINPDMLLGIGDFITSARGINRTTQKMKDAIRKGMIGSQQQMPTEFYSQFSDNGLHRMYDDRVKNMRQYKTVTSDPNQVMTERLMRDMNVDQMIAERDTKFSQMIDQHRDKTLAQKQQYANIRNQIVNENKNRWYQGLAQLDMADANKVGQQTQNVKNLIYQFRQDNARDMQARQQAELASNQLQAQNTFEAEVNSKYRPLYTPEMQKTYATFEEFMNNKYPKEYAALRDKHFANFTIDQYNNGQAYSWFGRRKIDRYKIPYQYISPKPIRKTRVNKKGGKVQRYRDVDEQAFLDQQKAINKAVNDLNNNIIKLFLKMMS